MVRGRMVATLARAWARVPYHVLANVATTEGNGMPLANQPAHVPSANRGAGGLIFSLLLLGAVAVLVIPLSPAVLDLLLAANLTLSVVILLTTVRVSKPLEFSVFPVLLLWTALARVVLNVASTRLILTRAGEAGTEAAGGVIMAFGQFVTAGLPAVGFVLFLILVVIQFVVVTSGAGRISEVAARFALDGMPGRQMAVDADLAAGFLTAEQARDRRHEIARQADFYGSMDGASKFVRGDAIAGLVITVVNIVGGLLIGVLQYGMTLREAAEIFTVLTIGDGLVSQVPALLIALASGLIVARSSVESDLGQDALGQVINHPETLFLAAIFITGLAFTGLPLVPLLTLGGTCAVLGEVLRRGRMTNAMEPSDNTQPQELPSLMTAPTRLGSAVQNEQPPADSLAPELLSIELGTGLLRLVHDHAGGDLLERVSQVRTKVAQELGFILPKVRICDNLLLEPRQYQIKLRDAAVAWGSAYHDAWLAVDPGAVTGNVTGVPAADPLTGRRAVWIELSQRDDARALGWQVWEPAAVVTRHLLEIVRRHADELLTRQQVHHLLQQLQARSPQLATALTDFGERSERSPQLSTWQVHRVLGNLLRENVPIRDLETIVETLADESHRTSDLSELTESVRRALGRTICQRYRSEQRILHAVVLPTEIEDRLSRRSSARRPTDATHHSATATVHPEIVHSEVMPQVIRALGDGLRRLTTAGHPPVLVCRPENRRMLRQLVAAELPQLAVLSQEEIGRDTELNLYRGTQT